MKSSIDFLSDADESWIFYKRFQFMRIHSIWAQKNKKENYKKFMKHIVCICSSVSPVIICMVP